jgi:GTP-binding protein
MDDHASRGRRLTVDDAMIEVAAGIFPPRAVDLDLVEVGRLLFSREARFVAGASTANALPCDTLPEIAFAGRSNVGKSSLVNALTGRRTLARTSNTPGRTRQINFFDLDARLMLVDLPGYGYAEASKTEIKRWTALLRSYLQTRAALRRVCLLIDARHGIKDTDHPLMLMLDAAGVSYQIVLTKIDRLGEGELALIAGRTRAEMATRAAAHPEIYLTSALKQRGISALRATLASFAVLAAPPTIVAVPLPAR